MFIAVLVARLLRLLIQIRTSVEFMLLNLAIATSSTNQSATNSRQPLV